MTGSMMADALIGGGMIGIAAAILLIGNGRIAGIPGILGGMLLMRGAELRRRLSFLGGLLGGGLLLLIFLPGAMSFGISRSLPAMALAGVAVGIGTRLGGGCTSGHGVCGVARGPSTRG